jgi:hypothetical protein
MGIIILLIDVSALSEACPADCWRGVAAHLSYHSETVHWTRRAMEHSTLQIHNRPSRAVAAIEAVGGDSFAGGERRARLNPHMVGSGH